MGGLRENMDLEVVWKSKNHPNLENLKYDMKNLENMSIQELKNLKSDIEKELLLREHRTTCIWSIQDKEKEGKVTKDWEGEKYIS